ncbi:MAG TPA: maleylpyruvate isomerase N-terminal domain-containing protein [Acidimicrobiales bacterium]|nr:maleylpyruvate isomerase N-terminal domain-containing protein [Acidimicrobiales bacterium]
MTSAGPTRLAAGAVATYLGAVDWLIALLQSGEVASSWDEPSALARYSVGGVAAHAVQGGVLRLEQLLNEPEPPGRVVTVAEFFGPNRLAGPDDDDPLFALLRAGAEEFSRRGPVAVVARCVTCRDALARELPMERADRGVSSVRVPDGRVPLADYLRTRVLEVVVHGDDLLASVSGLGAPDPPPEAVGVCLNLCVDLARARAGDVETLRAFTRAERTTPGTLRVL